jgi:tetratricopeptide (TPR) repeat protein
LFDEGRADLAQALLLFEKLGDDIALGHAHVRMAFVYPRQDRSRDAISHAEEALELFRAAGQTGEAAALNNIGWYHAELGDHERALDANQQVKHHAMSLKAGQATEQG